MQDKRLSVLKNNPSYEEEKGAFASVSKNTAIGQRSDSPLLNTCEASPETLHLSPAPLEVSLLSSKTGLSMGNLIAFLYVTVLALHCTSMTDDFSLAC